MDSIEQMMESPEEEILLVDDESALDTSKERLSLQYVRDALKILRKKEKEVISYRFGFNGDSPLTLEEIGKNYGVTRERIRQLEKKSKEKLLQYFINKKMCPLDYIKIELGK